MSDPLFVYGTLRYRPLLWQVLGAYDHLTILDAALPDHAVDRVNGHAYPMIRSSPGDTAQGLLIEGLKPDDHDRLNYYEWGFAYDRRRLSVAGRMAEVFFPADGDLMPDGPWDLEHWVDRWGPLTVQAAVEIMEGYGSTPPQEMARRREMINARAAAWVIAQTEPGQGAFTADQVIFHDRRRPYTNFFSLVEYDLQHPQFDGGTTPVLTRATFVGTDAAIVLPYDPVRDRVLLIEQFRTGPLARGDRFPWSLEPVAGRVDAGETPEDCARRETREEAGVTLLDLHLISRSYPSPGSSTEFFHIYLGLADLPDDLNRNGGQADENEDIAIHVFSFDDLMQMVDSVQIKNGPLVLAALWLHRNRDRLRGAS